MLIPDYLQSQFNAIEIERKKNQDLLKEDPSMADLVNEELAQLDLRKKELQEEVEKLQEKQKEEEENPKVVIMEIRAGAGGDEASLFALDLFTMYMKYAEKKNWRTSLISESKNSSGGYKEVVFEIKGNDVYKNLKNEMGVHRVQRVPTTEKMGRIHTSTASVAVLPERTGEKIKIKPDELEITFTHSGGPGGQNVNKVETAVRITHKPTGLVVLSQNERSQLKNKEKALSILSAKISDLKQEEEAKKLAQERKEQIGTQDRSEKIRTYNFPQDRITDHRVKQSWSNIPKILSGEIGPIVEELLK